MWTVRGANSRVGRVDAPGVCGSGVAARVDQHSPGDEDVGNYPRWRQYRHGNFQTPSVAPPSESQLTVRPRRTQPWLSKVFASVRDVCAHPGDLRLLDLQEGHIAQIPHDEMTQSRYGRLWRRVRWITTASWFDALHWRLWRWIVRRALSFGTMSISVYP